jgi:hypothetical protein
MSKWRVTVDLADPEGFNAGEIRDLVKWALQDNVQTEDMTVGAVTVAPQEGSETHVSSGRHYPRRVRGR